jgi:chloramphenicol O-acetyltransferase type B
MTDRPLRIPDRTLWGRVKARARSLTGKPPIDRLGIGDALQMGPHSYGRPKVQWYWGDSGAVLIGKYCSIAGGVLVLVGGIHPTKFVSTFPFRARFHQPGMYEGGLPTSKGDVVIGNDVNIGKDARILSGVTIGDGAVVGAFAVVARDVRPYAVVVGNPAREVKRRFADEHVERLLRIRWWDWPDEEVLVAAPLLNSDSIDEFLERYDPHPDAAQAGGNTVIPP